MQWKIKRNFSDNNNKENEKNINDPKLLIERCEKEKKNLEDENRKFEKELEKMKEKVKKLEKEIYEKIEEYKKLPLNLKKKN